MNEKKKTLKIQKEKEKLIVNKCKLKTAAITAFSVADTQLYQRLFPSVGPSVRQSMMIELKIAKTRIFGAVVELVCVFECTFTGREYGWA